MESPFLFLKNQHQGATRVRWTDPFCLVHQLSQLDYENLDDAIHERPTWTWNPGHCSIFRSEKRSFLKILEANRVPKWVATKTRASIYQVSTRKLYLGYRPRRSIAFSRRLMETAIAALLMSHSFSTLNFTTVSNAFVIIVFKRASTSDSSQKKDIIS